MKDPLLEGAERQKFALWAILAKEPDCRGDLWWGKGWVNGEEGKGKTIDDTRRTAHSARRKADKTALMLLTDKGASMSVSGARAQGRKGEEVKWEFILSGIRYQTCNNPGGVKY